MSHDAYVYFLQEACFSEFIAYSLLWDGAQINTERPRAFPSFSKNWGSMSEDTRKRGEIYPRPPHLQTERATDLYCIVFCVYACVYVCACTHAYIVTCGSKAVADCQMWFLESFLLC